MRAGTYLDDAEFIPAPSATLIDELQHMRTQSDEEVSNRQEVKTAEEIDSDCIRWGRALARSKTGIQDYNETERELEDLAARGHSVPVYVMLPLDAIWLEEKNGTPLGTLWPELSRERIRGIHSYVKRCKALQVGLQAIKAAGVEGVMVDVWWGIRGEGGPRHV